MKMSKVGNQTNSQDPQAVNSRIFVGNLNTFQCSKTDVERMFQRYGRLAGISMHKGFAFIQFTNPFDARSACLGEDGRTVLGQTLDVNLVAEPKPHQIGRKRPNLGKTGNDWDYFYDSYYASAFPSLRVPHAPASKRARLMLTSSSRSQIISQLPRKQSPTLTHQSQSQSQPQSQLQEELPCIIAQLKTYSNPDILICGNCRELFSELDELLQHKKTYCKLRFACKCNRLSGITDRNCNGIEDKISLLCHECKDSFESAWDLIVHVQAAHMMNVYELGVPKLKSDQQLSPHPTEHILMENGFTDTCKSDHEKLSTSNGDHQLLNNTNLGNNQTNRNTNSCFVLNDKSVVYTTLTNGTQ